ncbi:hypothetical protein ACFWZW_08995 [Microbacterium enclense]|uniref:hypothetical protein n=1 Tax=Microbacterium enclense TaxID=993073 RepID=UPI0036D79184
MSVPTAIAPTTGLSALLDDVRREAPDIEVRGEGGAGGRGAAVVAPASGVAGGAMAVRTARR